MRTLLRIAWRDLWRNRRRSLVNICAVGVGLFVVVFYGGLVHGIMSDAKNQLDNLGMGHVEVTAPGWRLRRNVSQSLENPAKLLASLRLPAGTQAGWRVATRALAASAHGSHGVVVHGVDPAVEPSLSAYAGDVRKGSRLATGDDRGVLLGDRFAETLHLDVGNKLRLMVQRADGEVGADLFRVRGVFHALSPTVGRGQVLITAAAAQRLAGLGDAGHQVVIQLDDAASASAVADSVRAQLGARPEVVTWADLMPALAAMEKMMGKLMTVVSLFVFLLVSLGIMNTMLMSVLERTREFGVMRAIGSRPRRVVALVLGEAFWIATLGVAAGLAAGLALTWLGSERPLMDFGKSMKSEAFEYAGSVMRTAFLTRFSPADGLRSAALVYVVTLLTALYPAWRVSRIAPAEALRAA